MLERLKDRETPDRVPIGRPREWEPGGEYVTKQLDRIWHKYTGQSGHYGLRDPKIDEKRVLFVCGINRIATFGEP